MKSIWLQYKSQPLFWCWPGLLFSPESEEKKALEETGSGMENLSVEQREVTSASDVQTEPKSSDPIQITSDWVMRVEPRRHQPESFPIIAVKPRTLWCSCRPKSGDLLKVSVWGGVHGEWDLMETLTKAFNTCTRFLSTCDTFYCTVCSFIASVMYVIMCIKIEI